MIRGHRISNLSPFQKAVYCMRTNCGHASKHHHPAVGCTIPGCKCKGMKR